MTDPKALARSRLVEAQAAYAELGDEFLEAVATAAEWAQDTLRAGGGVFLLGNGGSAADAQHWAAELVGGYLEGGQPLNVLALTTNSSTLTALVNDYPAEEVFERQVRAHVGEGDLLVAISTSGESDNVLRAVAAAKEQGAKAFGVTGNGGGRLAAACNAAFISPSSDTPRIQETHLLFGHCWCELVERACSG